MFGVRAECVRKTRAKVGLLTGDWVKTERRGQAILKIRGPECRIQEDHLGRWILRQRQILQAVFQEKILG